jgi:hypothetical protein
LLGKNNQKKKEKEKKRMEEGITSNVFSAMQTGTPYNTYKKTILGGVAATVFNQFLQKPEEIIMKGDPRRNDEGCFVDVWSEKEDVFFKNMNKAHLTSGRIIKTVRKEAPAASDEELLNTMTDEKLAEVLTYQWYKFKSVLNNITSADTVHRLLLSAREVDKSEKFIKAIEAKIVELEFGE